MTILAICWSRVSLLSQWISTPVLHFNPEILKICAARKRPDKHCVVNLHSRKIEKRSGTYDCMEVHGCNQGITLNSDIEAGAKWFDHQWLDPIGRLGKAHKVLKIAWKLPFWGAKVKR